MTTPTPLSENSSPFVALDAQGLNLQAVFNIAELPTDVQAALPEVAGGPFGQLLLIGNLGGLLWKHVVAAGLEGEQHPIDTFSRAQVAAWLDLHAPNVRHHFVYPGPPTVGLQRLGALAGWHHPSPFMVGVNSEWGSWFAYRVAVLADTALAPTPRLESPSPCTTCASRICVSSCPAGALDGGFNLAACLDHRRQPGSSCSDRCLARNSCPEGAAHRYSDAQIRYHYGRSMVMLAKWQKPAG